MCAGLALSGAAGIAMAQMQAAQPVQVSPATPAAGAPQFKSIIQRTPTGGFLPLNGHADLIAIGNNHLISMEDRKRIEPVVEEWMADLDQLVIDNLDLLEMIRPPKGGPGLLDTFDMSDQKALHRVSQIMVPLSSVGQLSFYLQGKQVLNPQQASLNNMIVSDYVQAAMNDMVSATRPKDPTQPQTDDQRAREASRMTSFLYMLTGRDALDSYERLLQSAAQVAPEVVAGLKLEGEAGEKAKAWADRAKAGSNWVERRLGVREAMNQMSFDQRRAFLARARELNPPKNPLAELPAPPPPPAAN